LVKGQPGKGRLASCTKQKAHGAYAALYASILLFIWAFLLYFLELQDLNYLTVSGWVG